MKRTSKFTSPLWVYVGNKKYILNLNKYRNWHYRVNNFVKIAYKKIMREQIVKIRKPFKNVEISYTVYRDSNRKFDIGNVCSIHQKFFEDACVEYGLIPDDKASVIQAVHYYNGGVDKENPCVMIEIKEAE